MQKKKKTPKNISTLSFNPRKTRIPFRKKKETVYLVDIKHEIGQLQKFFFEENCLIADN